LIEKSACDIVRKVSEQGGADALMGTVSPAARLVGIGFYIAFCIVLGTLGGRELDRALDTGTLFTVVGLFVGLVLAIYGGLHQLFEVLHLIDARRKEGKKLP
jgi:hypothetical protein